MKVSSRACSEKVWRSEGNWSSRTECFNIASIEVGGRWYCGTHNPIKVAARRAKREQEQTKIRREQEELKQQASAACQVIGMGTAEYDWRGGRYTGGIVLGQHEWPILLKRLG